jgi:hypothetical protein
MSTTHRLHDRALELAATALDFALAPADAAELDSHLAGCPACARTAAALRGDLAFLRRPATLLPSRRVDDAVHAAIAGREPRTSPQRLLVLVAATALLLVALLGVAAAGAFILQSRPPVVVVPSPSAPAVVVNPSASPGPSGAPVLPTPAAAWAPAPAAFPVSDGTAQLAAGPDGGTYVLVTTADAGIAERPGRSVLALLDATGDPRAGWPIAVDGWSCDDPNARPLPPETTADGSVTVVCRSDETSDGSVSTGVFRFDTAGRLVGSWSHRGEVVGRPRIVDGRLLLIASEVSERDVTVPGGGVESRSVVVHWIQEVSEDGTVRSGARVEMGDAGWHVVMGPDGTAYHENMVDGEITAFDLDGLRPGWPVRLGGSLSALGFGPDGRVLVTVAAGGATRLVVLGSGGETLTTSAALPMEGLSGWSGAGPDGRPMAPLVGDDGTALVIGEADDHTVVYAIDPSANVLSGWPYRADTAVQWQGTCPAETAGCGVWRAIPAVGPDGVVYLPLAAPDAQIGGSLVAIGRDGRAVPGWPMHLARRGAEFWSAAGSDAIAWALAVEPESGGGSSATILAFAADGTVLSRTTVLEP